MVNLEKLSSLVNFVVENSESSSTYVFNTPRFDSHFRLELYSNIKFLHHLKVRLQHYLVGNLFALKRVVFGLSSREFFGQAKKQTNFLPLFQKSGVKTFETVSFPKARENRSLTIRSPHSKKLSYLPLQQSGAVAPELSRFPSIRNVFYSCAFYCSSLGGIAELQKYGTYHFRLRYGIQTFNFLIIENLVKIVNFKLKIATRGIAV